jgi:hypothetical protein
MMMTGWNLPPGVTNAMIDKLSEVHCEICDEDANEDDLEEVSFKGESKFICRECRSIHDYEIMKDFDEEGA